MQRPTVRQTVGDKIQLAYTTDHNSLMIYLSNRDRNHMIRHLGKNLTFVENQMVIEWALNRPSDEEELFVCHASSCECSCATGEHCNCAQNGIWFITGNIESDEEFCQMMGLDIDSLDLL